jgi:SAM-dependent methyltransferase
MDSARYKLLHNIRIFDAINMETLDVGSGPSPKGTINLDLDRKFKPTVVAEARSLPFRGSIFDEAHLSHVLEHVVEPENILKEVHRVLKRGKRVEIGFPNFASISVLVAWLTQFNLGSRRKPNFPYILPSKLQRPYNIIYGSHTIGEYDIHHVPLTLRLMCNLLKETGFDVKSVKGEDFPIPSKLKQVSLVRALSMAIANLFPTRADFITIIALKKR